MVTKYLSAYDLIEYWNYLKLDHVEFERLYLPESEYKCGEFFTLLCGFGNHLIVSHFFNTGNKQILKLEPEYLK